MRRWALVVVLPFAFGCGPGDAPKRSTDTTAPAPATSMTTAREASMQPQPGIPRVVILFFGTREQPSVSIDGAAVFRRRLTELGYVEGKSIVVEERYADSDPQRLTQLAQEIVASKPAVVVTSAFAATSAARQATSTLPIVMLHAGNPVESGLVASLSHPGGNVTGTTSMVSDLGAKQVELLRQLLPQMVRLGVLLNPTNPGHASALANVVEDARKHDIRVVVAEVARVGDFDRAFATLRDAHPDALLVMMEPLIGANRGAVINFAAANRLPASYDVGSGAVREGGLISYGPLLNSHYAEGADYVDKILKGADPGNLPVQQPTQFALAINLKTANALGLTIPQALLMRADEVVR